MTGNSSGRSPAEEQGRVIWSGAVGGRAPTKSPPIKLIQVDEAWAEPRKRAKSLAESLSSASGIVFAVAVIAHAGAALLGRMPANAHWSLLVLSGVLLGVMLTLLYASRRVRKLLGGAPVTPKSTS